MTCANPKGCSAWFCWECLALWCVHYDSCKFYTGLPKGNPAPPSRTANTILSHIRAGEWWKFWKWGKADPAPAQDDPLIFKLSES